MNDFERREKEATNRVIDVLSRPCPTTTLEDGGGDEDVFAGCEGVFDPWDIIGCMYGSYSGDFDKCAIEVLSDINSQEFNRNDLAAHMFREVLCNLDLCGYGTSPRVCFATKSFKDILPQLIAKWKEYSRVVWGGVAVYEDG